MFPLKRVNDSVHWFMSTVTSRVVAESGIPTDVHHLGKILLQSLKDDPDFILQIDGGTGDSETNGSVLERSMRCAIALKNLGLQKGDVITLMAPNHLDLAIPFYAALYLGVIVSAIDRTLGVNELRGNFDVTRPKVVFCQSHRAQDVQLALNGIVADGLIVHFDNRDGKGTCSLSEFLEKYGDKSLIEDFKPTDFDPEETIALLIATSGSTELPKSAAATHKNLAISAPYAWNGCTHFPKPYKMSFIGSPPQWLSALLAYLMSPILRFTRLQTSKPLQQQHAYHLINTYKPSIMVSSPKNLITLITPEENERLDLSCFGAIVVGGSAVTADLLQEIKAALRPDAVAIEAYGQSECLGPVLRPAPEGPLGNCGVESPLNKIKLVDPVTEETITEPNVPGELWTKGPRFTEYYNNPEETAKVITPDGWYKTGDLLRRDEDGFYFFVERLKMLIKFRSYYVIPMELEELIIKQDGVQEVCVTSIAHPADGEWPVAVVARKPGASVTAQEIKNMVASKLSEHKQLRGGVVFVDELPMTSTGKVARAKVKQLVQDAQLISS